MLPNSIKIFKLLHPHCICIPLHRLHWNCLFVSTTSAPSLESFEAGLVWSSRSAASLATPWTPHELYTVLIVQNSVVPDLHKAQAMTFKFFIGHWPGTGPNRQMIDVNAGLTMFCKPSPLQEEEEMSKCTCSILLPDWVSSVRNTCQCIMSLYHFI